jgi:hypothetical protein
MVPNWAVVPQWEEGREEEEEKEEDKNRRSNTISPYKLQYVAYHEAVIESSCSIKNLTKEIACLLNY